MDRIAFYLEDYHEETVPCDGSLEGWAAWLSEPDADWKPRSRRGGRRAADRT